jgi:dienelactone hydrolase
VLLDPGHGTGRKLDAEGKAGMLCMYLRLAREAGLDNWLVVRTEILEQVGADGENGALPEDRVPPIFEACLRDLATRWHVDPDRMLVSGLSQTGFWAWELGAARPDRWLGIAPMSAVTWHVARRLDNLLTTRMWVLHGSEDPTCPVAQPRATCARLLRAGADVEYDEIEGGKHTYDVWKNLPAGLRALTSKPRERWPRAVSFEVQTLAQPWCHWLRLDELDALGDGKAGGATTAGIDGELDGNTVRLYSTGVRRASVFLSAERTDFGQPVTVVWNGRTVHQGAAKPSLQTLLATAVEKCDWTATYEVVLTIDAPE